MTITTNYVPHSQPAASHPTCPSLTGRYQTLWPFRLKNRHISLLTAAGISLFGYLAPIHPSSLLIDRLISCGVSQTPSVTIITSQTKAAFLRLRLPLTINEPSGINHYRLEWFLSVALRSVPPTSSRLHALHEGVGRPVSDNM
jgi:hypothetical protein